MEDKTGMDSAERRQMRDRLMQSIGRTLEERGEDYFRETMSAFQQKLDRISECNQSFADLAEDSGGTAEYEQMVHSILEATQDYYVFIGALPEDMRGILLKIMELEGAGGTTLEQLGNSLGLDIKEFSYTVKNTPLLSVQAIRPRSYIMHVDTISNHLATLGGQTRLKVGGRGSTPVRTTVTLDIPDHMRIEGGAVLSTYDKSLLNGVTSLIESGNTVFSIPMLYHAMTGKQNPTVDEQLADELTAKIEKMRRMMLTIDLTEENEARYLTDENSEQLIIEDMKLEGYLLPLNKISGMVNGRRAELYQIIQHPPLYTYSKMKRQLATVRIALLDAPINNNATTIPLKTYLLQRIELMKNKHNSIISTTILYESIYGELSAGAANKTRKMRIRSYTTKILDHFAAESYIKGYSEYKSGRSIAGLNIDL